MKTLIIYCSKTGFTQKYAQWLKEDLNCDCYAFDQRRLANLDQYDTIAFGSGCYVGRIHKLKWFKAQAAKLEGKKLAVFFTGAMPPDPSDIKRLEEENFTPEERARIRPFYLQGGLNYSGMNGMDRLLMAVFKRMLKSTAKTAEEKVMLQNIQHSFDKTDKGNLAALEEYLQA